MKRDDLKKAIEVAWITHPNLILKRENIDTGVFLAKSAENNPVFVSESTATVYSFENGFDVFSLHGSTSAKLYSFTKENIQATVLPEGKEKFWTVGNTYRELAANRFYFVCKDVYTVYVYDLLTGRLSNLSSENALNVQLNINTFEVASL